MGGKSETEATIVMTGRGVIGKPTSGNGLSVRLTAAQLLEEIALAFAEAATTEPVAPDVIWVDSGVVKLSVGIPPSFSVHPANTTVNEEATATFTVTASNATSYQWQKQESGAGAWSNIVGATSSSYTTGTLTTLADSTDKYRCVATGPGGSTTSNSATLTVTMQPPSGTSIWLRAQSEAYSNGANVSQWSDLSGNARHFTIGSNYPTFATNANNSKAAIVFNGTNQGLNRSYTGSGTAYTIASVLSQDSTAFRIWWQNGVNPYLGSISGTQQVLYRGVLLGSSSLVSYANWQPVIYRVSGTSAEVFFGTTKVGTATITSGALAVAGLGNLSTFEWDGKMQEIVAYESALSDANMIRLANYLNDQAGVSDWGRYVLCEGDSLTSGVAPATDYPTLLSNDLGSGYRVINRGEGSNTIVPVSGSAGDITADAATEIDPYAALTRLDTKKPIVVVWCGTNDLFYGRTGTQAHTDFAAYCEARQTAGLYVIALNMIARTESGGSFTDAQQTVFNNLFAANASTYSDAQIDVAAVLNDETNATYFNADLTHLKTAGNQLVADLVEAAILAS